MTQSKRILLALIAAATFGILWGLLNARADPVVRRARIALIDWPAGARPVTVALLGDIHLASPAMDDRRLRRIVGQVNALTPDLVVIAGDFIDGEDKARGRALARRLTPPLAGLRAPMGTVAVLGNHDHGTDPRAVRTALERAGITVLANDAVRRGPLAIVGIDDSATAHADVGRSVAAARRVGGARLTLSHDGQLAPYLTGELRVLLAGHSHCGQVMLPLTGPLGIARRFDRRYLCGLVREAGRTTVITAGLGTSILPIRFGAPPDLWLVTLGPKGA